MLHSCRHLAMLLLFSPFAFLAHAQHAFTPCSDEPGYHKLDFWLGEWEVFTKDGNRTGENRIDKILKGCAIIENWRAADGSEGKSWFYFDPHSRKWKQVWITEKATAPGGTKEKAVIEEYEDGGLRFQGEIFMPDGKSYLDRTTLRPLPDGRVSQVIEFSIDGGKTWKTSFDAYYIRKKM